MYTGAVDSSIYFKQQAPDIMGSVERGLSLGQMIKKQRDEKEIQNAYTAGLEVGPDGKQKFNGQATMADLLKKGYGQQALELNQKLAEQERLAQDQNRQNEEYAFLKKKREIDTISNLLYDVKDQPSYDRARTMAAQQGIDVSQMPRGFDPGLVNHWRMSTLTTQQRMDHSLKERELGFKGQELGIKKEEMQVNKIKAENEARKSAVGAASDLRKERTGLPVTKATQEVSTAYNKIQAAAKNPSAAGDLSLIFGYMKMLDPGSTVREGEFANAQNAAGIPDRVVNAYNKALDGTRLNESQRSDFLKQAENIYKSQLAIQDQVDSQFSEMARKSGINPSDVILNFGAQKRQGVGSGSQIFKTNQIEWAD